MSKEKYKRVCFHCRENVVDLDYMMLGLDRPYVNLFFHRDCYNQIKQVLIDYLILNKDRLFKQKDTVL